MMTKVVWKKSRPDDVEDEHGDPGYDEAREDADNRRDEEPFLDVARVSCRQVFIDEGGVLSQQRMFEEFRLENVRQNSQ